MTRKRTAARVASVFAVDDQIDHSPIHTRIPRKVRKDVEAQASAMLQAVVADSPAADIDAAGLIARHGLEPVASCLTAKIGRGLDRVVRRRRGDTSPEAVIDDYLARIFTGPNLGIRSLVRQQLASDHPLPSLTADQARHFVEGLLALHCTAVIELAADNPATHPRLTGGEHRRRSSNRK